MFEVLRKSFKTGIVTSHYPAEPIGTSERARGKPEISWSDWKDARPAAAVCPTGAISYRDGDGKRFAEFDLGKCVFCGLCEEASESIRMSKISECASCNRSRLIMRAEYALNPDGTHEKLTKAPTQSTAEAAPGGRLAGVQLENIGKELERRVRAVMGRSLHIREVDAGSCNGCEIEITALNSPIYDLERFGIHFVASPRHADMLLVTGPVTRNMELALRKTYEATPEPRLVVAVGACGCSGGIFGENYATRGGVDSVIPVDVYVPGCPPNPYALLHGILVAIGRWDSLKK